MNEFLFTSSNSELLDRPLSVMEQPCVNFPAFDEFLEETQRFGLIVIDFPEPAGPAVLSVVFDKSFHVAERISEEQADFMGKPVGIPEPFL